MNKKNEIISFLVDDKTPLFFETKDAAENHIDMLIHKAYKYANKLASKLDANVTSDDREKIIGDWLDKIEKENSQFCILIDYACDMLDGKEKLRVSEPTLFNFGYKIVQCVAK